MKKDFPLRYRQIHLDFHTGPQIPDVGADFDARAFAREAKRAHVDSVTVFAKCHHGHLYYNTKRPERHPGLAKGLDLLRGQVDALHAEGIRAPIYISVQCDEYAADTHPDWIAQREDGSHVGPKPLEPGWQILDLASPYQEFLAEQTAEVLRVFRPVDGIFFDMCWDQPSWNPYRLEAMHKEGFDPTSADANKAYATVLSHRYMKRFYEQVKKASADATVFFNCRPFFQLSQDIAYQTQAEIEALPTGGWGYMYFPINVRYARTFGKPVLGMTARFHKSWADFGGLKPVAALEYETAQMIAHGARCSVGDQLHPRGVLDKATYELIGHVYGRVEEREPWLEGARPVSQVGLFQVPSGVTITTQSTSRTDEGATRMLTQLRQQFDVVQATSDLEAYELLVLPDAIPLDGAMVKRLAAYVKRGGAILASYHSGLAADGRELLLPELSIRSEGASPFTSTYIRFGSELSADVPDAEHVMYERGLRVTPVGKAKTLARVVEPYFERAYDHFCSHKQTPYDKVSKYAAAVQAGRVGYISYPIFTAFAVHGNYPYRLLVRNLLERIMPEPLVRVGGPTGVESTVMRQGKRTIVHVLYYSAERRTEKLDIIEDVVPLHGVAVSLWLEKAPKAVYLAPSRRPLEFTYAQGRAEVVIPVVRGHEMVVFE